MMMVKGVPRVFSNSNPFLSSNPIVFDPIFPIQKKKKTSHIKKGFPHSRTKTRRKKKEGKHHGRKNSRLHDARVHRGVHIPRLAGGVLSHGCVFVVFVFLSVFLKSLCNDDDDEEEEDFSTIRKATDDVNERTLFSRPHVSIGARTTHVLL